jgi:hypothetical protein
MTQTYEAPPLGGGDFEKRFDGQSKTFSKYTNCNVSFQGPRHIGELADTILLAAAEQRLERLAKRFPKLSPSARIDVRREAENLAALIRELRGDRRVA